MMKLHLSGNLLLITMTACCLAFTSNSLAQDLGPSKTEVVLASEVEWQKLNPARGDKSPQAATLWGDRNGTVATGFLVKFIDGFSSPPHIHNVTYRGVVIQGLVHNDDPDAKPMWMPNGSFWTQPAGEPHITSARGSTVAFIEIDNGPYLVKPIEEAFDRGERPVNVDASNIVWLDASNTNWIKAARESKRPEIAFLWGKPGGEKPYGTLIKLPPGSTGTLNAFGSDLNAVVIQGETNLKQGESTLTLTPGSHLRSKGNASHHLTCSSKTPCLIYVRSAGRLDVVAER